jgi:hypothetical protein
MSEENTKTSEIDKQSVIIDTSGRELKLAKMYDNMAEVVNASHYVITTEPVLGDIDETYSALIKKIT